MRGFFWLVVALTLTLRSSPPSAAKPSDELLVSTLQSRFFTESELPNASGSNQSLPKQNASLPEDVGWHELPNTQLAPHCPERADVQGNSGCQSVISAWNSGVADTRRQRLVLWGGGHSDYFGNELYSLDLLKGTMDRLTDPSPTTNVTSCPEAYVDGSPSARHTYNGLAYDSARDAMYTFGGSKSNCGFMTNAVWKLSLESLRWERLEPKNSELPQGAPGYMTSFDSRTGMVYVFDTANFFRYDPGRNEFKKLSQQAGVDYHLNGTIDEGLNIFVMFGGTGQLWAIDLTGRSKFKVEDWSRRATGCEKLMHAPYPGLAYDGPEHSIVGWVGGDSVILFHGDRVACEERAYPGGPGPAMGTGSNGRFRYFPSLRVFALVNGWKQNAFLLRLGKGAEGEAKPETVRAVTKSRERDENDPVERPRL